MKALMACSGRGICLQVPVEMVFDRHRQPTPQNGNVDAMGIGKFSRAPICEGTAKKGEIDEGTGAATGPTRTANRRATFARL